MKDPLSITPEEAIALFKLLFPQIHSPGFMVAEITDLLRDPDYRFIEQPNYGYINITESFLTENGYSIPVGLFKSIRP